MIIQISAAPVGNLSSLTAVKCSVELAKQCGAELPGSAIFPATPSQP